jgi:hypothetical protein
MLLFACSFNVPHCLQRLKYETAGDRLHLSFERLKMPIEITDIPKITFRPLAYIFVLATGVLYFLYF